MRSDMLFGITEEAFSSFLLQANRRTLAETIRFFFEADDQTVEELRAWAGKARDKMYGKRVFFRALIEFSSWCKNDCYYCGLQRSNQNAVRYRLSDDEIISCCRTAYERGTEHLFCKVERIHLIQIFGCVGLLQRSKNSFRIRLSPYLLANEAPIPISVCLMQEPIGIC